MEAKETPARNDALTYVENLNRNLGRTRAVGRLAIIVSAFVAVLSVAAALYFLTEQSGKVYVVRQDAAFEADARDRSSIRDKEVYYHVQRFHERFYNLAPNMETINENINQALGMGDLSVLQKDNRRKEQQFYSKLVENLAVEEIRMDSLKVDMGTYPYKAHYYGRLYIIRNTTLSEYLFESTCRLINVPSSSTNISGLLIEQFSEVRRDLVRSGNRK